MPPTPTILAIDTAADVCSVALACAGGVREHSETVGHRHSERVLPMVRTLLASERVELSDCDALAFGAGPGAFTGLRIACGVVQGLAYGAGKPVIAVGNLEALAWLALQRHTDAARVLCANDARMQEAYVAVYQRDGEDLIELSAPALAAGSELAELIDHWAADLVVGDAPVVFSDRLAGVAASTRLVTLRATATAICERAVRRWTAGDGADAKYAAPLYVRNHVALTIEERRARQGRAA